MHEATNPPQIEQQQPPPPTLANPRFILELEFVLSLANPYYLSHLAVNHPHLLGTTSTDEDENEAEAHIQGTKSRTVGSTSTKPATREAQAFTAYLAYLYSYWRRPEYAQFLTHPGATLRALRLLQEDRFRKDIIRPQVIEALLGGADDAAEGDGTDGREQATTTAPATDITAEQVNENEGPKT
jgi:mediator of RNA polymerase II transcription subunit 31